MATTKPTPRMWTAEQESVKKTSLKNEKRLAEAIGFKTTPSSGNQPWPTGKGDGSHPEFMFECKESTKSRVGITESGLMKVYKEARAIGKEPALVLSAYGLPDPLPKDWVCVPAHVFAEMLRVYELSLGIGEGRVNALERSTR